MIAKENRHKEWSEGQNQVKARKGRKRAERRTVTEKARKIQKVDKKRNERNATGRTPNPTHREKGVALKTPVTRRKLPRRRAALHCYCL